MRYILKEDAYDALIDGIGQLKAENAKLRELCADLYLITLMATWMALAQGIHVTSAMKAACNSVTISMTDSVRFIVSCASWESRWTNE